MSKKFEITEHHLVPEHVKVSEKERAELLSRLNISLLQLPHISIRDPAIKNLDVKAGDVIKIVRNSPTAGEIFYYRCVIDG